VVICARPLRCADRIHSGRGLRPHRGLEGVEPSFAPLGLMGIVSVLAPQWYCDDDEKRS
jgi:hypothetical protein